jgi:hypothetical protein
LNNSIQVAFKSERFVPVSSRRDKVFYMQEKINCAHDGARSVTRFRPLASLVLLRPHGKCNRVKKEKKR